MQAPSTGQGQSPLRHGVHHPYLRQPGGSKETQATPQAKNEITNETSLTGAAELLLDERLQTCCWGCYSWMLCLHPGTEHRA